MAVNSTATALDDELQSKAHEFADKLITFLLSAEMSIKIMNQMCIGSGIIKA